MYMYIWSKHTFTWLKFTCFQISKLMQLWINGWLFHFVDRIVILTCLKDSKVLVCDDIVLIVMKYIYRAGTPRWSTPLAVLMRPSVWWRHNCLSLEESPLEYVLCWYYQLCNLPFHYLKKVTPIYSCKRDAQNLSR